MTNQNDEVAAQVAFLTQWNTLHIGIGQCIMRWADVEIRLCVLFSDLLGIHPKLAWAMWDAVISFDAKLKLLDVSITEKVKDQELLAIWNKLSSKIRKKAKKRHEIAHGSLLTINDTETVLIPYGSLNAMTNPNTPQLKSKELNEREQSFGALLKAIGWLSKSIAIREGNASANLPPPPDLVREIRSSNTQSPKGI